MCSRKSEMMVFFNSSFDRLFSALTRKKPKTIIDAFFWFFCVHLSLGQPFPNTENDGGGPVEIDSKAEIAEPRSNGTDVQQALSMN